MKNLFLIEKALTTHKSYCIQIYWSKPYIGSLIDSDFKILRMEDYFFNIKLSILGDIFNFHTRWTRKIDHAGFMFDLTILGFSIHKEIYDVRHWDFEKDNWVEY